MPGNQTDTESYVYIDNYHGNVSPEFIALVIVSAVCPGAMRNVLTELYRGSAVLNNPSYWISLMVDYCMTILPVELVVTLWNTKAHHFLIIAWVCMAFALVTSLRNKFKDKTETTTSFLDAKADIYPAITVFRSYVNILTAFSILAVDFKIYPEYFYKTRIYGNSLMDTGLGFFLIANAIVSPEARGLENSKRSVLIKTIKETTPLLLLGVMRYWLLLAIGYHVPINDYGVHWNFYITLAFVKFCSTMIYYLTPKRVRQCLGIVIICLHQYFLLRRSFHRWIILGTDGNGSRDNFLDANREGIVSSVGFLAIYFIGVEIGVVLMKQRETIHDHIVLLLQMVVISYSSLILLAFCKDIQPPSRKLANMSYMFFVIWVSISTLSLSLFFVILTSFVKHFNTSPEHSGIDDRRPGSNNILLEAINYNGLVFFVLANILTGTINLCIDTSSKSDTVAFIILSAYMFILSVMFTILYKHKIRLKAIFSKGLKRQPSFTFPTQI